MAETLTTRFGLRIYGAGTDTFSRTEYNDNMNAIEDLGAIDQQGLLSARPAGNQARRYYFATDNSLLYRDDGTTWRVVGAKVADGLAVASAAGTVPFTAQGATSQTANLFEAKNSGGTVLASISSAGLVTGDSVAAKSVALSGNAAATTPLSIAAHASQSANVVSVVDGAAANLFGITPAGIINSKYFRAGDPATGAVLGNSTLTTVANMAHFSGVANLEVYSDVGGAGTFNDFVYLKHAAADGTAVSRRLGFLMKVGDETVGDATKSGGLMLESSAASFGNPTLSLLRGNAVAMSFPATGAASLAQALGVTGTVTVTPSSNPSFVSGNTAIGDQGSDDSMYLRVAAGGLLYFFAGGTHSDTGGAAGSGGTVMGSIGVSAGVGQLSIPRGIFDSFFQAGAANSFNIQMAANTIQSFNNGVASTLAINPTGGNVNLGATGAGTVNALNTFSIQGKRIFVQASTPSSPAVGDIWLQNG